MGETLARLLDRDALDEDTGPRGRLRVTVPADWLAVGAAMVVGVPRKVVCARCDGGGCDGCARRGAFTVREGAEIAVTLPAGEAAVQLRLVDPLGDGTLAQLLLEVMPGERASEGVRRRSGGFFPLERPRSSVLVAVLLALLAAAATALLR